jgi:phospholipid/cholesterol/gamma-HCH transport system substrate-binding protein
MKKTTANKARLGIFVFASLILFILAIYYVGERQQLFSGTFHISGTFKDISGLQVGNNVRFSGINVGIVKDIEQITDSTVRVDMQIENGTQKFIKTNAKAIIGSDGLMGSKLIIIVAGPFGFGVIADNAEIGTEQAVSMENIMENLELTTRNAGMITSDLAVIIENMRNGKGAIGRLLMDSTMGENIGQTIINIREGTGGFKQNMDAASHNVLLRGYLKKKKKAEVKKAEDKKSDDKKALDKAESKVD